MRDWTALALDLLSTPGPAENAVSGNETLPGQNCQNSQNSTFGTIGHFGHPPPHSQDGDFGAHPPAPLPYAPGPVGEWQRAFSGVNPAVPPCPLFRNWPGVCRVVDRFLATHGEAAAGLGWTTLELFGVHRLVGTIRPDCSGALMLSNGRPVEAATADAIRFAGGLTYRRTPFPPGNHVVAVWGFGR